MHGSVLQLNSHKSLPTPETLALTGWLIGHIFHVPFSKSQMIFQQVYGCVIIILTVPIAFIWRNTLRVNQRWEGIAHNTVCKEFRLVMSRLPVIGWTIQVWAQASDIHISIKRSIMNIDNVNLTQRTYEQHVPLIILYSLWCYSHWATPQSNKAYRSPHKRYHLARTPLVLTWLTTVCNFSPCFYSVRLFSTFAPQQEQRTILSGSRSSNLTHYLALWKSAIYGMIYVWKIYCKAGKNWLPAVTHIEVFVLSLCMEPLMIYTKLLCVTFCLQFA